MKINYNVDDNGILRVYNGNAILFEISECQDNTDEEIQNIIMEQLKESEV